MITPSEMNEANSTKLMSPRIARFLKDEAVP